MNSHRLGFSADPKTSSGSTIRTAILSAVVLTGMLGATIAYANAPRVTKGDAEAIFQAFGGGGWAVRLHSGAVQGAPADFSPQSLARISPVAAWDGKHFCVLDWHVINLALFMGNGPGDTLTNTEIRDILSGWSTQFTLDGTLLQTERTSPRRFLNPKRFGAVELIYINEGRIMSPEELAVGEHTLQATALSVGDPPQDVGTITFYIDAAGTGTCLPDSSDALIFREIP